MDLIVQKQLLENINHFARMTLKSGHFEERKIGNKTLLVLELTFSDEGLYKTMVLVLDKEITEGDYKEIAEKILERE